MTATRLVPILLLLALPVRWHRADAVSHAPGQVTPVAPLPARLMGHRGVVRPLSASEQLLARSPRTHLVRRRYGPTEVALVTTTGIKEHHPPAVCLRASGLEVSRRAEERVDAGCLVHLWVRPGDGSGPPAHFVYAYLHQGQVSCDYSGRVARAVIHRLWAGSASGDPRWTTVQVLDADPHRARRAANCLIRRLQTQKTQENNRRQP